jgi:hypothetical protein
MPGTRAILGDLCIWMTLFRSLSLYIIYMYIAMDIWLFMLPTLKSYLLIAGGRKVSEGIGEGVRIGKRERRKSEGK